MGHEFWKLNQIAIFTINQFVKYQNFFMEYYIFYVEYKWRCSWLFVMFYFLKKCLFSSFKQPKENYNEWRLIYFISFLLLVGFFVLNMFVGVVVENFHKCREDQEKEERERREKKRTQKREQKRKSECPYDDVGLYLSLAFYFISYNHIN